MPEIDGTPIKPVYHVAEKVEGHFKIESYLVDQWVKNHNDVIVADKKTMEQDRPLLTMLTEFELRVDGEHLSENTSSYHKGVHHMVKFKGMVDHRHVLADWERQLLKRFHPEWYELLRDFLLTDYFVKLNKVSQAKDRQEFDVLPPRAQVYRAFEQSPFDVKVVLVGQDPYPNDHANGLAFATDKKQMPPSLQHIYAALLKSYPNIPQDLASLDMTLVDWQKQGVLLLNSALSVIRNQPGIYKNDWEPFIREVLWHLSRMEKQIVFVFFGKTSQEYATSISTIDHKVIMVEHPAAAAHAKREWHYEDCFRRINSYLKAVGASEILWLEQLPF